MRLCLVHPPLSLEARYGALGTAGNVEPPFGICWLAAVARKLGHEVSLVDAQTLGPDPEAVVREVARARPDVAGFSATTAAYPGARRLAARVKAELPACVTVLGGCHVTALPAQTMEESPEFDLGVVGEGEPVLGPLLAELGKPLPELGRIPGLVYRRDGRVLSTGRARPMDMDDIPFPALDLLPDLTRRYRVTTQSVDRYPSLSLITSRGCAGMCAFCDLSVCGSRPRAHGADYTYELLRWVTRDLGVRSVMFQDDNFLFFKKRLEALARRMRREPLDLTWSCMARVDTVSPETLALARSMGCWQVMFGLESGSPEVLRLLDKNITPERAESAVRAARRAGLRVKAFFILGCPGESRESMAQTLAFCLRLPLSDISIGSFTPYPGAPVYERIGEYGTFDRDWEKMTCFTRVFVPNGLTEKELAEFERRMYRAFYMRPRVIADYLSRVRSPRHFLELAGSGLALFRHALAGDRS